MTVRVEGDVVRLEGECGVEDAEAVAAAFADPNIAAVDLHQCRHLHGAVVQALLVFRPKILAPPADEFLTRFVMHALAQ